MDKWKYSLVSQFVSNVILFSLVVETRSSMPFFVSLARHNTTDSRQQCSCCQRSATMFAVFLHRTAVLNCVRATHGLPADRASVYRGCPCRDPLGCPLIPSCNCCMRVRVRSTLDMLSQTHSLGQMYVTWISTDLACTVTHRTSSI